MHTQIVLTTPLFCSVSCTPTCCFFLPPSPPAAPPPLTECQRAILRFKRYTFIFRFSSENRHPAAPPELVFPYSPYHTDHSLLYINLTDSRATDCATNVGQELERESEWQPPRRLKGICWRGCALTAMYKHSICCEAGGVHAVMKTSD